MNLWHGYWYRSRSALEYLKALKLVNDAHVTPDGYAVLIYDVGGRSVHPVTKAVDESPPYLIPQADSSTDPAQRDLMHVTRANGQHQIRRVEIPIEALSDLERLVEYDHIPEGRKDYSVYPRGHKLA